MSYSFNCPCWNCTKKNQCKDAAKIQTGISHIHNDNDGTHMGAGMVIMMCCRLTNLEESLLQSFDKDQ